MTNMTCLTASTHAYACVLATRVSSSYFDCWYDKHDLLDSQYTRVRVRTSYLCFRQLFQLLIWQTWHAWQPVHTHARVLATCVSGSYFDCWYDKHDLLDSQYIRVRARTSFSCFWQLFRLLISQTWPAWQPQYIRVRVRTSYLCFRQLFRLLIWQTWLAWQPVHTRMRAY